MGIWGVSALSGQNCRPFSCFVFILLFSLISAWCCAVSFCSVPLSLRSVPFGFTPFRSVWPLVPFRFFSFDFMSFRRVISSRFVWLHCVSLRFTSPRVMSFHFGVSFRLALFRVFRFTFCFVSSRLHFVLFNLVTVRVVLLHFSIRFVQVLQVRTHAPLGDGRPTL